MSGNPKPPPKTIEKVPAAMRGAPARSPVTEMQLFGGKKPAAKKPEAKAAAKKPAAKKPEPKKPAPKPVAKKAAPKPVAKKPVAKKPVKAIHWRPSGGFMTETASHPKPFQALSRHPFVSTTTDQRREQCARCRTPGDQQKRDSLKVLRKCLSVITTSD